MVRPTLKRSARIRKNENDDCTDGPTSKRRLASRKSELDNELSSSEDDYPDDGGSSTSQEECFTEQLPVEEDDGGSSTSQEECFTEQLPVEEDDYLGDSESSISQEECFIEQLPVEILEVIFNYLAPPAVSERKYFNSACTYLRLVCKTWCDILSHHQRVYFVRIVPHAQLENCSFGRIRLQLYEVDLSKLPLSTWEKIGCKVDSLVLKYCKIGDQCLKNITMHCCNLQSLEVVFEDHDNNTDLFCSPDMLKELRITKKNLRTFKIINAQKTVNVAKWIQIFEDFFKIFPNVEHFTSGCSYNRTSMKKFQLKFSKRLDEDDVSRIATTLAYSLSTNESHLRQAVDASSTLRLDNVSVCFSRKYYFNATEIISKKFARDHTNLKFVEFIMDENEMSIRNFMKLYFFTILEASSYLGKESFQYFKVIPLDKLHTPPELGFFFPTSCFSRARFIIHPSSNKILAGFVMSTHNLQLLDVESFPITDDILQSIFKNMINLRTLSIRVTNRNTNFGITGHHKCDSMCRLISHRFYSIDRLKNLEELTIIGFKCSQMDDTIFHKFIFPKLLFLSVDLPNDPVKFLPIMGRNMPALVKIDFSSKIKNNEKREDFENFEQSLVLFCQQTEKLRQMILHEYALRETTLGFAISTSQIIKIFKVCPSLRYIEGRDSFAYYDPSTCQLAIKDVHQKTTNFYF